MPYIEEPQIIYQDNDIVVINKPAGWIVNRADTTKGVETLQDWVEREFKTYNLEPGGSEDSDFYQRAGIVHRLDKETSGVILAAKNEESFVFLQQQFKERLVEKMYLALSHGRVVPREGEISVPVGRLPWDRKKFGVVAEGRESKTLYKVVEYKVLKEGKKKVDFSLVEAYPKTGRTHQIRVHLRYLGYPIAGDALYAGRKNIQQDRKYLSRHFLHAAKIQFTHPSSHTKVTFESLLPKELQNFLDQLSSDD